jgi:hypothetical protein
MQRDVSSKPAAIGAAFIAIVESGAAIRPTLVKEI